MIKKLSTPTLISDQEHDSRNDFYKIYEENPIPDQERLTNIALFLKRQDLSKLLFIDSLYRKSLTVHGSVFEFGTRWGRNLVTMMNLRGIYEPYNSTRNIIGFDSFSGFPSVDQKDGSNESIKQGNYTVTDDYASYLRKICDYHATESPLAHVKRHEIVEGDVEKTVPAYLEAHPETVISFAYFDLDIYSPTKRCLEAIKPYLTKGSVLGFDELHVAAMPGETIALRESLGLENITIERNPYSSAQAFVII